MRQTIPSERAGGASQRRRSWIVPEITEIRNLAPGSPDAPVTR